MKPQLLKIPRQPLSSFSVRQDTVPYINNKWHYHIEAELIYFKKGNGTQFIGDHIQNFNDGDLILVGSNLPHYLLNEFADRDHARHTLAQNIRKIEVWSDFAEG